jgi:hypothetical protein
METLYQRRVTESPRIALSEQGNQRHSAVGSCWPSRATNSRHTGWLRRRFRVATLFCEKASVPVEPPHRGNRVIRAWGDAAPC